MFMSSRRVGGLAGLGFVATVLTVNIIQGVVGQPMAGASKSDMLEFYADNRGVLDLVTGTAPIAWVTLILFAAGVVAALRPHERLSGDTWSLAGFGGVVMQSAIFPGVVATQAALSSGTLSDDSAWALWQVHNGLFTLNTMSLAIVLLSFSIGGSRAGLIRGWQKKVGLVAAATMAAAAVLTPLSLDGSPVGLLGFGGFILWLVFIASTSVRLLRGDAVRTEATAVPELVHAS
jgi:hypothetical protein